VWWHRTIESLTSDDFGRASGYREERDGGEEVRRVRRRGKERRGQVGTHFNFGKFFEYLKTSLPVLSVEIN
jgi:hypothetical protein